MTSSPTQSRVSVLVPTHNRAEFILGAVRSALAQTHANVEVVVGVNGCTDDTEALVRSIVDPRLVVVVQHVAIPMYDNFNALVQAATGDYVLVLSDDDVLHPDAIENLAGALLEHAATVAFGAVRIIYLRGGDKAPVMKRSGFSDGFTAIGAYLQGDVAIYPCGTLLLRSDLLALGGYDDKTFSIAADVAAWILIAGRRGRVAFCDRVVADYMVHDGNETVTSGIEKWVHALDGIRAALECIDYPNAQAREAIFANFAIYRGECIGRSQSSALARGGLTLARVAEGARIMRRETRHIPLRDRLRIFTKWCGRMAVHSLRRRLSGNQVSAR